jgi:ATP-dependent Clp protease ATP-binding subunit ClpX
MVTTLAELTEEQLVQVLTEPRNALTKQYQKLLAMEGVDLEFTDCALRALAREAIHKGTGARALRSLIEKLMLDVMFEVPHSNDISGIKITGAVVNGESKPVIQRRPNQAAA